MCLLLLGLGFFLPLRLQWKWKCHGNLPEMELAKVTRAVCWPHRLPLKEKLSTYKIPTVQPGAMSGSHLWTPLEIQGKVNAGRRIALAMPPERSVSWF